MIMHIVASPVRPKRGANLESPKSFFIQLPALATCRELPRQAGAIFQNSLDMKQAFHQF
jgi:hypothetical protein